MLLPVVSFTFAVSFFPSFSPWRKGNGLRVSRFMEEVRHTRECHLYFLLLEKNRRGERERENENEEEKTLSLLDGKATLFIYSILSMR